MRILFSMFVPFLFAVISTLVSVNAHAAATDSRFALVIGNGNYSGAAKLKNPVNDAREMAAALRLAGFDVLEKTDLSQKEFNKAIAQFGEKLNAGSTALFFYAGHGIQVRGKNYLIPIDAEISGESAVRAEAVDVDVVLDQFWIKGSKLNVVILDACRNNPYERRFRSGGGGGLAQIEAPEGTMIAYATAPGKVASDGTGENGIYTQELLRAMRTSGRPVEQVFKDVRRNVMMATNGAQTPWESSSLTGDFYFSDRIQQDNVGKTSFFSQDMEGDAWKLVETSSSIRTVQTFLENFPSGRYASIAKIKISRLTDEQKSSPLLQDSNSSVDTFTPRKSPEIESQTLNEAQKNADIQKRLRDFVNAR